LKIEFEYLGIKGKFSNSEIAKRLIQYIIDQEKRQLGTISIVFTDNPNILKINIAYLKHSYYTDVITFDYGKKNVVSGDIFISIEQVRLNSREYKTSELEELFRVIIHGVLHLIGYVDDNEQNRDMIRRMEDQYLKALGTNRLSESDELML
jgi:probable rRNA maturation factor